jgi:hypothetical protein
MVHSAVKTCSSSGVSVQLENQLWNKIVSCVWLLGTTHCL